MKTIRKLISLALALVLAFSCLSMAFAAGGEEFTVTYVMPENTFSRSTYNQKEEIGTGFETKEYEDYTFVFWSEEPLKEGTKVDYSRLDAEGKLHSTGDMVTLTEDKVYYAVYNYTRPLFIKMGIDKTEGDYALVGRSTGADGHLNPDCCIGIQKKNLAGIDLERLPDTIVYSGESFVSDNWDIVFRFHEGGGPDGSRTIFDPVKQQFLCYDQETAQLVQVYRR